MLIAPKIPCRTNKSPTNINFNLSSLRIYLYLNIYLSTDIKQTLVNVFPVPGNCPMSAVRATTACLRGAPARIDSAAFSS